jgi:hypothetical protein
MRQRNPIIHLCDRYLIAYRSGEALVTWFLLLHMLIAYFRQGDITTLQLDSIVNAANKSLLGRYLFSMYSACSPNDH